MDKLGKFAKVVHTSERPITDEQLINEIVAIAQVIPDEVEKFFYARDYTFLRGAELNQGSIEKTMVESILPPLEKTWKDYLSDIPYNTGFYIAYPFLWLAYWFRQGVAGAKIDIWD